MDTIQNAACELYIPYNKALRPALRATEAEDEPKPAVHHYSAIAISEGVWNGATFSVETLDDMVSAHNSDGSAARIRMCAEHEDTITSLLGRTTVLRMENTEDAGAAAVIEFDLFDGTQMQQDIIKQIEQAPDLIGLSICATGDLAPLRDDAGKHTGWVWQRLRLAHIAILTWPGCDTTAGSIVASYKHADGTEINPAIFTQEPTEYAMEDTHTSTTDATVPEVPNITGMTYSTSSTPAEPQRENTKYATALDLAQVISLSRTLGIDPNPELLASLTPQQAKDYAAELGKIAEARPIDIGTATAEPKGSEYGAATDDTLDLARQLLNYGGNAQ